MNVMSTTPMILPRNSPHSGGRSLLKPPEKPPLGKGKERKAGGCRCGNATACPGMPFKTINFKKKNWPWIRQWQICVTRECRNESYDSFEDMRGGE